MCTTETYHSSFHFIDGVEVKFLIAAVNALYGLVSFCMIVNHNHAGQFTSQILAKMSTNT
jgi:hypothetical protein